MILDGSLGARTAVLKEPYSDDPSAKGILNYTEQEVRELADYVNCRGVSMVVHAIGDKTTDILIDIFKNRSPELRNGIVHLQITSFDQI